MGEIKSLFAISMGRAHQAQFANYHPIPEGSSTFASRMDSPMVNV